MSAMPRLSVREKLIEAAYHCFYEQGFNGCGVKDITDAAGVPKGSFYNHFDSKEALAIEVMRRYSAAQGTELLADDSKAPLERLRAHFAHLAAGLERFDYTRGAMIGNFGAELATQSPAIREVVDNSLNCWVSQLAPRCGRRSPEAAPPWTTSSRCSTPWPPESASGAAGSAFRGTPRTASEI
jgi:TetR/AcrR family transcriptional repressor of nem operon